MPQDISISPDGKVFFVAEMMAGGVYVIDGDAFTEVEFIPTGIGTARALPEPRREEALRSQPRLLPHRRATRRKGQRLRHRFRHAQDRDDLAHPWGRQPRHGQRERRWQGAVALRPLRQRRLRHRHRHRRR